MKKSRDRTLKMQEDARYISSRAMRRKMVIGVLVYCALVIAYIVYKAPEAKIFETIVDSLTSVSMVALVSYIGGALTQDTAIRYITKNTVTRDKIDTPPKKEADE